MKGHVVIGLKDSSKEDIKILKAKYTSLGYTVAHITKNLPFNGVLRCTR